MHHTAVVTRQFGLTADSGDPNVLFRSPDGAKFTIQFAQPILVPADAYNIEIHLLEATVWNTVFNISAAKRNNQFYALIDGINYQVTIPDGNYSVSELNDRLQEVLADASAPPGIFFFSRDAPSVKTILTINGAAAGTGAQVDFAASDTFHELLGFNAILEPPVPTTSNIELLSPNTANFFPLEYFKFHSDVSEGVRVNGVYEQTLAVVHNAANPPGTRIVYRPREPVVCDGSKWRATRIDRIRFWITDENNQPAETGQPWTMQIQWKYNQTVMAGGITPAGDDIT